MRDDEKLLAWTDRIGDPALRDLRRMSVLHDLGRWTDAIEAGRRALALNPQNPAVYIDLGFFLTQQRRYAEAETVFAQALAAWPNSADLNGEAAYCYHSAGKYRVEVRFVHSLDVPKVSALAIERLH
jgi:tetratricopeptide (TPR) repeat protein